MSYLLLDDPTKGGIDLNFWLDDSPILLLIALKHFHCLLITAVITSVLRGLAFDIESFAELIFI